MKKFETDAVVVSAPAELAFQIHSQKNKVAKFFKKTYNIMPASHEASLTDNLLSSLVSIMVFVNEWIAVPCT